MGEKTQGRGRMKDDGIFRSAEISECGEYRTELVRVWNRALPVCVWCAMNPSTADGEKDDPSVRKMMGFSARLGYGGFHLLNVLALRTKNPKDLAKHPHPRYEPNNPSRLAERAKAILWIPSTDPVIMACGDIPKPFRRDALEVIRAFSVVRCLGFTQSGMPRHPLMLAYSTKLVTTDFSRWLDMAGKLGI